MITPEDFENLLALHYTGGVFNGFDNLGYIGNGSRNYVTDAWVLKGANALGWGLAELGVWMTSKPGRWALDSTPMSAKAMQVEMAKADLQALLADSLESREDDSPT